MQNKKSGAKKFLRLPPIVYIFLASAAILLLFGLLPPLRIETVATAAPQPAAAPQPSAAAQWPAVPNWQSIFFGYDAVPTATPSPSPEPTPTPVYQAELCFVGDLMVHEWQLDDARDASTGTYDFHKSFDSVSAILQAADYTVGNLETVFAGAERGYKTYPTFNTPDSFVDALKAAGFDLLTTANNHCNDMREAGILRTLDILDDRGLDHTGTFRDAESRDRVLIKEINNIRFAFLSYTYGTNGIPVADGKPYLVNLLDEETVKSDLQRAKALSPDFIVVLPHMGDEYHTYPRENWQEWVRKMTEWGADVVMASHPHVLQPAEYMTVTDANGGQRLCFVAYSMGNFVSSQRTLPRDAGVIFKLRFEKTEGEKAVLTQASYIPTWVKFVNDKGVYDIRVLSVYDVLTAHDAGEATGLRPKDIARVKDVQAEAGLMLLGAEPEDLRPEYALPVPQ